MTSRNVRPPNDPWNELQISDNRGTISIYLSDSKSNVPIRDVSHQNDPKADPNIETETYGLFSYCHKQMRKSIVVNGIQNLFFCTSRLKKIEEENELRFQTKRVLSGYYKLGWFYEVEAGDFMLAAKEAYFVNPGFLLEDLSEYLYGVNLDTGFFQWKYLDERTSKLLELLLTDSINSKELYVEEIRRLEQESLAEYGHMYRNRKTGFDWNIASFFLK